MISIINNIQLEPLAQHEYLIQIGNNKPNLQEIYRLLLNARQFTAELPKWYASLIARIDDCRIQSILARQLNDELGNGDLSKIHLLEYDKTLQHFKQVFGDLEDKEKMLAPGSNWVKRTQACWCSANVDRAIGVVIASEIRALEFNIWFGEVMQRQQIINLSQLDWYKAHSELEIVHAEDSVRLADLLITDERRKIAETGVLAFNKALWTFLDEMKDSQAHPVHL